MRSTETGTAGELTPGLLARAGMAEARRLAADQPARALTRGIEALAAAGRMATDDFADFLFDVAHRTGDLTAAATVMELRRTALVARMLAGTPRGPRPRRSEELLAQLGDIDERIAAAEETAAAQSPLAHNADGIGTDAPPAPDGTAPDRPTTADDAAPNAPTTADSAAPDGAVAGRRTTADPTAAHNASLESAAGATADRAAADARPAGNAKLDSAAGDGAPADGATPASATAESATAVQAAGETPTDASLHDLHRAQAAIVRQIAAEAGPAVAAALVPTEPAWADLHRRIPPEASVLYVSAADAGDHVTVRAAWLPAADLLARQRIQGATQFTLRTELRGSAYAWFRTLTSGEMPYQLSLSNHPWQRILAAELLPLALYEFLVEQAGPLEPHRLIVAPAGRLWSLPFAALTVGPERTPLVEVAELSLIPALAMLNPGRAGVAGRDVLAFAGPAGDFDVAVSALEQRPFGHVARVQVLDRPAQLAPALTNAHWDLAVVAAAGNGRPGLAQGVELGDGRELTGTDLLGPAAPAGLVLGARLTPDAGLPTAALLGGGRLVICGIHPDGTLLSKVYQGLLYKSGTAAVREAQLEAIARGEPPFSWAALAVLAADDRRVLG